MEVSMVKLVLFIVLCLYFANTANAQGNCQYFSDEVTTLNKKIILISTKQPVNGVVCRYTNGDFLTLIIKNGLREGIARNYDENGRLRQETPYKNDVREGYAQIYMENGRLFGKILYRNDEAVSGNCADERAFTNAELINWENGHTVYCGY